MGKNAPPAPAEGAPEPSPTPPQYFAPQSNSLPMYAAPPPPPPHPHYQYSAPYPFPQPYYQPPVYLPWPQSPSYPYYPPPQPVWAQDADGKRPQQVPPQHFQYPPRQPQPQHAHHHQHPSQGSYTFAVGGVRTENKPPEQLMQSPARGPPSPGHQKRLSGRRRSSTPSQNPPNMNQAPGSAPNSASSTPSKTRTPGRAGGGQNDGDEVDDARRTLDKAARQAVSSADEVTLALLLTSWADSLAEAQQQPGTSSFQTIFHASNALEIVSESILFMDISPDSGVQRALVSLYGFVLYGDEGMHRKLADESRAFGVSLAPKVNEKDSLDADSASLISNSNTSRDFAVHKVLNILRRIANDVNAYGGVLPTASSDKTRASQQPSIGPTNASPAGPDPAKVVERSMDEWRRSCARLQGEMAVIVVLEEALASLDSQLNALSSDSQEVAKYFAAIRGVVKERLQSDIEERKTALRDNWWAGVATTDAAPVFDAVDARACVWLGQFHSGLTELEAQLDNIGLGFGPAARVSPAKVPALVSASAGVAALVSTHQQAVTWCQETARLLSSMAIAFRALANTNNRRYLPPKALVDAFSEGMTKASVAIVGVQEWSFEPVHGKILGSLQKSASSLGAPAPRARSLRFEEPDKSEISRGSSTHDSASAVRRGEIGGDPDPDNSQVTAQQRRRKPRHARMKSSPDELLHLNAHLDVQHAEDGRESDVNGELVESSDLVGCTEDSAAQESSEFLNGGSTQSVSSSTTTASEASGWSSEEGNSTPRMSESKKASKVGINGREDELAIVYENKPLEHGGDDDDDDDHDIIVHEDVEGSNVPKKSKNPSHVRSMSVDGIPFGP